MSKIRKSMIVLPPGTLLQLMHLRKRLQNMPPGYFIEVGPGSGEITKLLLNYGWSGVSYDLDANTIEGLKIRFSNEIAMHRFIPINADYLTSHTEKKADLVISCMVLEHLEDQTQLAFMHQSMNHLKKEGIMIGFVPSSPSHWGIEDDIAGHYRRYTRNSIQKLATECNWRLLHIAGLTFPLSNFLLPISNFLVNRSERAKLTLSVIDRTKLSGRRHVNFKTHFPPVFAVLLNRFTLLPLYFLQRLFTKSKHALVLYFELKPNAGAIK